MKIWNLNFKKLSKFPKYHPNIKAKKKYVDISKWTTIMSRRYVRVDQWEAGIWSCDLRANERPRKKLHEKGTSKKQRNKQRNKHRNKQERNKHTLRLLDQLGPLGENHLKLDIYHRKCHFRQLSQRHAGVDLKWEITWLLLLTAILAHIKAKVSTLSGLHFLKKDLSIQIALFFH